MVVLDSHDLLLKIRSRGAHAVEVFRDGVGRRLIAPEQGGGPQPFQGIQRLADLAQQLVLLPLCRHGLQLAFNSTQLAFKLRNVLAELVYLRVQRLLFFRDLCFHASTPTIIERTSELQQEISWCTRKSRTSTSTSAIS